ncbi:MAG: serine/threonine-protein kinase [Myxococcota bacterium]|nr:serine/threonine-protein kinase [Myxococcota bacterium]
MKAGDIISGYELLDQVAEGGMGTIWRARHPHIERIVAIKFIRADVQHDAEIRSAFHQEVQHLSKLHSPQIVQVTDYGVTDSGAPFMVTEYLHGEDLRTRLLRERKLSIRDALFIGVEVLKALSEAHGLGLIHRDLKPGNIFLQQITGVETEAVKVLDFGVAKLADPTGVGPQVMPSRGAKGSPRFMAPEQIVGDPLTPATDIYSFGATLYRALTGEHLFSGSPVEVLQKHIESEPTPICQLDPDGHFSAELEDIVMMCLKKSPSERPSSAAALRTRLELRLSQLNAGHVSSARAVSSPPAIVESDPSSVLGVPDWLESTSQPSRGPSAPSSHDQTASLLPLQSVAGDKLELDWRAKPALSRETVPEDDLPAGLRTPRPGTPDGQLPPADERDETLIENVPTRTADGIRTFKANETTEDAEPIAMMNHLRGGELHPPSTMPDVEPEGSSRQDSDGEARSTGESLVSPHSINTTVSTGALRDHAKMRRTIQVAVGIGTVGLLIALALQEEPAPHAVNAPQLEVDASVADWLETEAMKIRRQAQKKNQRPGVVNHFERAPSAPEPLFVTLHVEALPATFADRRTGRVLCANTLTCRVTIDADVNVSRAGYRTLRVRKDDLYDRRNGEWRLILRK